jgi:hypothetical protein
LPNWTSGPGDVPLSAFDLPITENIAHDI